MTLSWHFIETSPIVNFGLEKCTRLPCDVTVWLEETVAGRGQSCMTVQAAPGWSLSEILHRHQGRLLMKTLGRHFANASGTMYREDVQTQMSLKYQRIHFLRLLITWETVSILVYLRKIECNRSPILVQVDRVLLRIGAQKLDHHECKLLYDWWSSLMSDITAMKSNGEEF